MFYEQSAAPKGQETPGSAARRPSPEALLLQYREDLRPLGKALHPLYTTSATPAKWAPPSEAFLTYLATHEHVSASTQNQALVALLFLYRYALHIDLEAPIGALRAKRPKRLPTVLSRDEVQRVLSFTQGTHLLLSDAIIWTPADCSAQSDRRRNSRASPNRSARIPFATLLRRTYWRAATTSAPCRNCWDTRMSRQR